MANFLKKLTAVIISLSLIFTVCFTGVVHSAAQEQGADALAASNSIVDSLTGVATVSTQIDTATVSYKTVTNLAGGGVNIKFTQFSGYAPYRYSTNIGAFPANGLRLCFDNYTINEANTQADGYGQIVVVLSYATTNSQSKIKKDVPFLQLDTVNGQLLLRHCNDDGFGIYDGFTTDAIVIPSNNSLKYDNLKQKQFDIIIAKTNAGNYTVRVVIGSTEVNGIIEKTIFEKFSKRPVTNTYVSIGGLDNNNNSTNAWSIDFYGYKLEPSFLANVLTGVASAEQDITPAPSYKTVTNLTGGGVNIKYNRFSGYEPYHYPVNMGSFYSNGITLQFSNYVSENTDTSIYGHGQLLIFLTNSTVKNKNKLKTGVPVILINTVNGTLSLASAINNSFAGCNVEQTVISSDILKYSNFAGRDFDLSFIPSGNDINVVLTVDGQVLEGLMDGNIFNSFINHPTNTNTYVSIGGLDNDASNYNTWSVEFYGYKSEMPQLEAQITQTASDVAAYIAALPEYITIDDANMVLYAKAIYDALSSDDKLTVQNFAKLEQAYTVVRSLQDAKMYKPTSTFIADYPEYTDQFPDESHRTTYSCVTDNGFSMEFKRPSSANSLDNLRSQTLTGKYSLDGLSILLDNFSYTGESDFYLSFTSGDVNDLWDGSYEAASRQLVLGFGHNMPSLWLGGCGYVSPVSLGENAAFLRQNLVGKKIKVEFYSAAGGYNLYVTVGEQVIGYYLSNAVLQRALELDTSSVRVMIATAAPANEFKIECNGIYAKTNPSVQAVMDIIEALPQNITLNEKTAVENAYSEYKGLSVYDRQFVINYPALNKARNQLRLLDVIDDKGYDSYGYYVPSLDDITENFPETSKAVSTQNAQNGGLHIDFNNTVFGQRQYITERFVIENITLRFDNLQYANGGFMVGFTSQAVDGGIWNLLGGTGRFGFYLLIGKDSSVYINYPYVENKLFKVMESPLLSMDNLQNKEFFVNVRFTPGETIATNNLTISMTVDGTTITKNLDELDRNPVTGAYVYAHSMDQFKYDSAQLIIQSASDYNVDTGNIEGKKNNFSVDLTGIKATTLSSAQQQEVDKVIAAINALPDIASLEYEQQIGDVWNQYFELTLTKCRQAVINYDKLLKLHDDLFNLKAGKEVYSYSDTDRANVGSIDNTNLLPKYQPSSQVELDSEGWPVWTKDLVMTEIRVKTCSPDGTFLGMQPVLQHLAETGVNCIWLSPTMDHGTDNLSDYCHYGPHTICPYLTGQIPYGDPYDPAKVDYVAGYQVFKEFVDLAHSYGIYILIDRNSWGLANSAPTIIEHPEWFRGDSSWGGQDFITQADVNKGNAKQEDLDALYEWFISTTVEFMLTSGADGIHWGLEPDYFGYNTIVKETLNRLRAAGTHPVFFSEASNSRQGVFAFEQFGGVSGNGVSSQLISDVFFRDINIVESIKTGKNIGDGRVPSQIQHNSYGNAKYYEYQMSCHDVYGYRNASHASWAYQFVFGSFIPLFYIGEEWNSSSPINNGLYGWSIRWDELNNPENKLYHESIKKLMRIRWQYKDLVNSTADNHRDTNICTVDVLGTDLVQGYARYADNQSLIVIPNVNERSAADKVMTFNLSLEDMNLKGYKYYTLTDMLTGDMIFAGNATEVGDVLTVSECIEYDTAGIYLLSGNNENITWEIDADGTLTINGNGAISTAPWLSADTTVKNIIISKGITSFPDNAFAGFAGVESITVPESLSELPDLSDCNAALTVCGVQNSAIINNAKASGYNVLYTTLVDSTYGISVEYPAGVFFEEGTNLIATKLDAPANIFGNVAAYALAIALNSTPVALAKEVTVTIPYSANKTAYVYKVVDGLATDEIDASVVDEKVCFKATQLGSYAVSIHNNNGVDLGVEKVIIGVSGNNKTVKAFVSADYLNEYSSLAIGFTENGGITKVTNYTVVGNMLVFSYNAVSNSTVVLSAFDADLEIASDIMTVTLDKFTADGAQYAVYDTLDIGDANLDGVVDVKDLVRIKKALAGLTDGASADVSGDNDVTTVDLVGLAKLLVSGKKGIKVFEVKFVKEDGRVLDVQYVIAGFAAKPAITDAQLGDGFIGWDIDITSVTSDLTATAVYDDSLTGTTPEDWPYDK